MNDAELWTGFHDRSLTHAEWKHRAHLRIAWLHLDRWDVDEAHLRMRVGIIRLNTVHGTEESPKRGYHETMTRVWFAIVAALRRVDSGRDSLGPERKRSLTGGRPRRTRQRSPRGVDGSRRAALEDPRPRQTVEEVAAAAAPFCPRDPPSDNAGERWQEILESLPPPHAHHEMQLGAHVGEVVNADIEPTGHPAEHVAHDAIVLAQRPRTARSMAREHEVHRAARADGPLALAAAAMNVAAVFRPRELGVNLAIEEGQLHRWMNLIIDCLGAMSFPQKSNANSRSKFTTGRGQCSKAAGGAFPAGAVGAERASGSMSRRAPCPQRFARVASHRRIPCTHKASVSYALQCEASDGGPAAPAGKAPLAAGRPPWQRPPQKSSR
jgi:hypothetical protein